MRSYISFLMLLISCGNAEFIKHENKSKQALEEAVTMGLEILAQSSDNCANEKLRLVRKDKAMIQNLVAQVKNLNSENFAKFSVKTDDNQFDMIYQIITSDGFKVVVSQTSDLIKTIANNDIIIDNLTAIRDDLLSEPGDRMAEIITTLALDTSKQNALLGAVHSVLCDNLSETDIVGVLMTPQVLWQLSSNAMYLLASPLAQHGRPLWSALKETPIPEELSQFVALVKDMLPKQNICAIENLDAYQKHLTLVLSLLKAGDNSTEARPLRNFINVLFKLYSMKESNECLGTSFDNFKKETVRDAFLTVANFLADDQYGVMSFLKKIKPRNK